MSLQVLFRTAAVGMLLLPILASAQTSKQPKLAGNWELDNTKSHVVDRRTVTLSIDQTTDHLTLSEVIKTDAGKKTISFTCTTDAVDCDFDEGGHKSKIAVWYNGESLICCKTGGPVGDLVNEWHLKISPDSTTLTIDVEHVDPVAPPETLIFKKAADTPKPADQAHK